MKSMIEIIRADLHAFAKRSGQSPRKFAITIRRTTGAKERLTGKTIIITGDEYFVLDQYPTKKASRK